MTHHLKASPETCHWGYFDARVAPALTIASGDTVTIESVSGTAEVLPPTGFHVPPDKAHRLAACYAADGRGGKTLQDDPASSSYLAPPSFVSGGGGLCATAADYLTFCRAMLNRGELDGVRLLGPKTLALMTSNHLPGGRDLTQLSKSMFSEATYAGVGFGLGFSVTLDPAQTMIAGSAGEYAWGGAATTSFWIDPAEDMIVIFMTQLLPSSAYPVRRELRSMIYAAITASNLNR